MPAVGPDLGHYTCHVCVTMSPVRERHGLLSRRDGGLDVGTAREGWEEGEGLTCQAEGGHQVEHGRLPYHQVVVDHFDLFHIQHPQLAELALRVKV